VREDVISAAARHAPQTRSCKAALVFLVKYNRKYKLGGLERDLQPGNLRPVAIGIALAQIKGGTVGRPGVQSLVPALTTASAFVAPGRSAE
jgi:hypothetical protein